jgi:hypothetical protein
MGSKQKTEKEKPLEKMTVKDLREMALTMSEISGAHGMNKLELISKIKEVKGIADVKKDTKSAPVRDIKVKIRSLKTKRVAALSTEDSTLATRYRRMISRLKKKTRRQAV